MGLTSRREGATRMSLPMADSLEAIDFEKYFAFRNIVKHALKLTMLWRFFFEECS